MIDVSQDPVTDIKSIKEECLLRFDGVLKEIFDSKRPFIPEVNPDRCELCDYRKICGK